MPTLIDIVLTLILVLIIGAAVAYIIKAKKSGAKCIGCPASSTCSSYKKNVGCGCNCDDIEKIQMNNKFPK